MRRELNWKIITEKYLFSLFTEHHSDDLKCQSRVDTTIHPPQLTRAFEGLGGGAGPTSSPARVGSVWLHPNEGWGRRMKITTEWRGGGERKGGCKKKKQKREWEGKQLLPSPFPVQPLLLAFSQRAHKHTHARIHWFGVVGHINRTTKRRTGGGAHTLQPGQHHISPASSVRDERTELLSHICWELKRQSDWRWPSQKR